MVWRLLSRLLKRKAGSAKLADKVLLEQSNAWIASAKTLGILTTVTGGGPEDRPNQEEVVRARQACLGALRSLSGSLHRGIWQPAKFGMVGEPISSWTAFELRKDVAEVFGWVATDPPMLSAMLERQLKPSGTLLLGMVRLSAACRSGHLSKEELEKVLDQVERAVALWEQWAPGTCQMPLLSAMEPGIGTALELAIDWNDELMVDWLVRLGAPVTGEAFRSRGEGHREVVRGSGFIKKAAPPLAQAAQKDVAVSIGRLLVAAGAPVSDIDENREGVLSPAWVAFREEARLGQALPDSQATASQRKRF